MKNPLSKEPEHGRLGTIGHSVTEHTAEAGQKIREEFDEVAPKVAAAAAKAAQSAQTVAHSAQSVAHSAQSVAHTAAERSRPVRAEAASRGSAALSGLLGTVTPEQIERVSRRNARRSRGKIALLLAAVGGVVAWALWWKRSETELDPWEEEPPKPDPDPIDGVDGPSTPTP